MWGVIVLRSAVLIALGMLAYRKRNIHILFYIVFSVMYGTLRPLMLSTGFYATFAYLNPSINQPSQHALFESQVFLLMFEAFLLLGAILARGKGRQREIRPKRISAQGFVLVVSPIAFVAPLVLPSTTLFSLATLVYFTACSIRRKEFKMGGVRPLIWVSLIFMWLFLFSEDRRDWLIPVLLLFFYSKSIFNVRAFLIRMAVGAAGVVAIAFIAISFRTNGIIDYEAVLSRLSTSPEAIIAIVEVETDFSIVYDDYSILFDEDFQNITYLYGLSFIKPIVAFIPRSVWPGKPETSSRLFPKYYNPGFYAIGGSEPVTVWGEFYWNFGWFGIIFGSFVGWALRGGDKLFGANFPLKLSSFLFMFHLLRGPFDSFWVVIVFLFLFDFFAKAFLPQRYFDHGNLAERAAGRS